MGQTKESRGNGHAGPVSRVGLGAATLGALGVVYGDIGTSPLYAVRESFVGGRGLDVTEANVLGVLSVIFWSMIAVISVKYLLFVMRADDRGEGGILALQAIASRNAGHRSRHVRAAIVVIGLFGTALLYGDGMITPAISVLSAIEGLGIVTTSFEPFIIPIAIGIIIALFALQPSGTATIGRLFGPVMLVWFTFLAVAGLSQLVQTPAVIQAINPIWILRFFEAGGFRAFLALGSIFLVVTGSEALYADLGHFGHRPINIGWHALVLPALFLQYLGQGALLLRDPEAIETIFYNMVPQMLLIPTVILATMATIIASQALISGAFSLTSQAIQLGFLPRLEVRHTSNREIGQVYVPMVNWALMVACVALVLGFRTSSRLAAAYGVAVVLTMVITTLLFTLVARDRFKWRRRLITPMIIGFLVFDLAFLGANLFKVPDGGWFPLIVGGVIFLLLITWKQGRRLVSAAIEDHELDLGTFLRDLDKDTIRVPGTAVFMYAHPGRIPPALLASIRRQGSLHQSVVLLSVMTEEVPHVPVARRAVVEDLGRGFTQVVLKYGFAEDVDVPKALHTVVSKHVSFRPEDTYYFLGAEVVRPTMKPGMALWREKLFVLMDRNAGKASRHFHLPADRVIEVGQHVEI